MKATSRAIGCGPPNTEPGGKTGADWRFGANSASKAFRIALDQIHARGDASFAWGMAPWTSTGYDPDGRPFERPGRTTVILEPRAGRWLAVHTHFSLVPGTPATTHERRGDEPVVEPQPWTGPNCSPQARG